MQCDKDKDKWISMIDLSKLTYHLQWCNFAVYQQIRHQDNFQNVSINCYQVGFFTLLWQALKSVSTFAIVSSKLQRITMLANCSR